MQTYLDKLTSHVRNKCLVQVLFSLQKTSEHPTNVITMFGKLKGIFSKNALTLKVLYLEEDHLDDQVELVRKLLTENGFFVDVASWSETTFFNNTEEINPNVHEGTLILFDADSLESVENTKNLVWNHLILNHKLQGNALIFCGFTNAIEESFVRMDLLQWLNAFEIIDRPWELVVLSSNDSSRFSTQTKTLIKILTLFEKNLELNPKDLKKKYFQEKFGSADK